MLTSERREELRLYCKESKTILLPTDEVLALIADATNSRCTDLPVKYGKDHSARLTIRELVEKLAACEDKDSFCDTIDAEFLFGAHGDWFTKSPPHHLLRDIRGLVWACLQKDSPK